jgi:hypothetical protein
MSLPPEKWTGVLGHTPDEKRTELVEDTSGHLEAQPCRHPATRTKRLPAGSAYFARLGMSEGLSNWKREFVRDSAATGKLARLSSKEQALVARLYAQYQKKDLTNKGATERNAQWK